MLDVTNDEPRQIRNEQEVIGWTDDNAVYLLLNRAYNLAKAIGQKSGLPITVESRTLAKLLVDQKFVLSTDSGKNTIRKTFNGERHRVIHLPKSFLRIQ